VITRLTASNRK